MWGPHSLVKEDGSLSSLPGDLFSVKTPDEVMGKFPRVIIFHRTCRPISPYRIDGFGDVLRKEETHSLVKEDGSFSSLPGDPH